MLAQDWMQGIDELVEPLTRAIDGDCPHAQQINRFYVQQAGLLVWVQSGGAPCWSKLEVATLMRQLEELGCWSEHMQATAVMTLLGFYTWLFRTGRLARERCVPVLRELERYVNEPMWRVGYRWQYRSEGSERIRSAAMRARARHGGRTSARSPAKATERALSARTIPDGRVVGAARGRGRTARERRPVV